MHLEIEGQAGGRRCQSPSLKVRFSKPLPADISSWSSTSKPLPYIDSSGIGSVVNALRQANKIGGTVKLVNPAPFVSKTFKMVGILSLFGVYDSADEAVAACSA